MILGIDCGGTKTEAVVMHKNKVIDHFLACCPADKKTVYSLIKKILKKYSKIDFIGIGFPSPINQGKAFLVHNIPEWNNTNIEKEITNRFKIKCKVENDANCFALSESCLSENSKHKIVAGITLGTGLGCGIIIDKKIIPGKTGAAGEINNIPYKGKTIENYVSKKFFKKYKKEAVHMFRLAETGDKSAIKHIKEYSRHLGVMLSMVVNCIEPDCVVFGGNISKSFHLFKDEMLNELKKYVYPETFRNLVIKKSELKYSACIGAAMLAKIK